MCVQNILREPIFNKTILQMSYFCLGLGQSGRNPYHLE